MTGYSSGNYSMEGNNIITQEFSVPISNSSYIGVNSNSSYIGIETLDVGDLTLTDGHKFKTGTKNDKDFDIHGDVVNYKDENLIPIYPDRNGCNQMAGSCETDEYLIVSYKDSDDTKQRIVFYDKKTNKQIGEYNTDKLDHTNSLTTDGKRVYIVNAESLTEEQKKENKEREEHFKNSPILQYGKNTPPPLHKSSTKISSFDIKEFLTNCTGSSENAKLDIDVDKFRIIDREGKRITQFSSMDYDPKTKTLVATKGLDMYIVKDDKVTTVRKNDDEGKGKEQFATTSQDICVAKDSIFVIRTKIANNEDGYDFKPPSDSSVRNKAVDEELAFEFDYTAIDVYDLNGNYKYTKKVMMPSLDSDSYDLSRSPATPDETSNPDKHSKLYRELESLSYDEKSDSFTLYFNNPFHNATAPHVIARGVKIDSAKEVDHNMLGSSMKTNNNVK